MQTSESSGWTTSSAAELSGIYHTAFLLRQRLPVELIPDILIHADLLRSHTVEHVFADPGQQVSERNSPGLVISTPCIPHTIRHTQRPVHKVVFEISSHDQGWADQDDEGSWTWFTASIQRDSDDDADDGAKTDHAFVPAPPQPGPRMGGEMMPPLMRMRAARANNIPPRQPADSSTRWLEREVVRNDKATHHFKTYTTEWRSDAAAEAVPADIDADAPAPPAEADWVQELHAGDRIRIHAWAQFVGWRNVIKSVKVTVFTAVIT